MKITTIYDQPDGLYAQVECDCGAYMLRHESTAMVTCWHCGARQPLEALWEQTLLDQVAGAFARHLAEKIGTDRAN